MLRKLSVTNYALIDRLEIEFGGGLTIITGETGSGKSILLGALSLILGQRADTSVLANGSAKCIIEGEFNTREYDLEEFFSRNDLDLEDVTIIRREINESGKSRAFVNDTPVNLNILKDLGAKLVDIHSQHGNLILSGSGFSLGVVDVVAGNGGLLDSYMKCYRSYISSLEHFNKLKEQAARAMNDLDYIRFQLDQLTSAKLTVGEQLEIEDELRLLSNAGEIREALSYSCALLDSDDNSLLVSLKDILVRLGKIEPMFRKISDLHKRIESSLIELKDVTGELATLESTVESDPDRQVYLSERLDLLYSLQQKHNTDSVEGLIGIRENLYRRVAETESYDLRLEEAEKKLREEKENLSLLAEQLTRARKDAIPRLEDHMGKLLRQLGIPNASFTAEHSLLPDFSREGVDRIVFMFSANLQAPPMELSRVASGGEMSRVMLGLKSLVAKTLSLPTIIFDEIDSGVSGEIAGKMGDIMKDMAENMQVINITHLPQIAGKGHQQFHVYKEDIDKATHTRIRLLTRDERIREIARMLSNDGLSEAAIVNARELLGN